MRRCERRASLERVEVEVDERLREVWLDVVFRAAAGRCRSRRGAGPGDEPPRAEPGVAMNRIYYASFMFLALAVFLAVRHFVPRPAALQRLPWWKRVVLALWGFIGGALGAKVPVTTKIPPARLTAAWSNKIRSLVTSLPPERIVSVPELVTFMF